VTRQDGLHDRALDADPASVDQTHLAKAALVRGREVLLHDGRHVARRERMQIDRVLDRDPDRLLGRQIFGPVITCCCQWS
jgi:hypothetical protein